MPLTKSASMAWFLIVKLDWDWGQAAKQFMAPFFLGFPRRVRGCSPLGLDGELSSQFGCSGHSNAGATGAVPWPSYRTGASAPGGRLREVPESFRSEYVCCAFAPMFCCQPRATQFKAAGMLNLVQGLRLQACIASLIPKPTLLKTLPGKQQKCVRRHVNGNPCRP